MECTMSVVYYGGGRVAMECTMSVVYVANVVVRHTLIHSMVTLNNQWRGLVLSKPSISFLCCD